MKDLGDLMKQMSSLQAKMTEMQKQLEAMEVEGVAGGGLVKVVMSGKGQAMRVAIDPSLLIADEKEVVEDLVAAAVNDAKNKVEVRAAEEMKKLTGGLPLPPGMQLPL